MGAEDESKACRDGIIEHWTFGTYVFIYKKGNGTGLFVVAPATKVDPGADLVQ